MTEPSQIEQAAVARYETESIHVVTLVWETNAHGLAILGSVKQELEEHGKLTTEKIETVQR